MMIDHLLDIWSKFRAIRTVVWLRAFCFVQCLTCVILAILSAVSYQQYNSPDSIWYYLIQIPITCAMMVSIVKTKNEAKLAKYLLIYVGITMILGLIVSFYFMIFFNDYEISRRLCEDQELVSTECDEQYNSNVAHILRSAVYLVVQVACVHPAISFVIDLWSKFPHPSSSSVAPAPAPCTAHVDSF